MRKCVLSESNYCNLYFITMIIYMLNKVWIDRITFGVLTYVSMLLTIVMVFFYVIRLKKLCDARLAFVIFVFSGFIVYECIFNTSTSYMAIRAIYEYIYFMFFILSGILVARTVSIDRMEKIYDKVSVLGAILPISALIEAVMATTSGYRAIGIGRSEMATGVLLGIYIQILYSSNCRNKKAWKLIMMMLAVVALISTGSRGPMAATFIATLINVVLHKRSERGYVLKFIVISLIAFILVYVVLHTNFRTGNSEIDFYLLRIQSITNWNDGGGNSTRLGRWDHYYQMYLKNFWIGIGPSKTGSWDMGVTLGATESALIRHLVELGTIGAVLYYYTLLKCLVTGVRGFTKRVDMRITTMYILHFSIFAVVFVEHFVLQITEEITCAFFMWWALGFVFGLATRKTDDSEDYYRMLAYSK